MAQVVDNVLNPCVGWEHWDHNVIPSMVFGGVFGGVSFGVKRWLTNRATASAIERTGICFEEGTLVTTQEGHVPIETVQVGDLVLAADPETGEMGYRRVTALFSRHVDALFAHRGGCGLALT